MPINWNEDGEESGAGHLGGQWNFALLNYERFVGDTGIAEATVAGAADFMGGTRFSGSVRFGCG